MWTSCVVLSFVVLSLVLLLKIASTCGLAVVCCDGMAMSLVPASQWLADIAARAALLAKTGSETATIIQLWWHLEQWTWRDLGLCTIMSVERPRKIARDTGTQGDNQADRRGEGNIELS